MNKKKLLIYLIVVAILFAINIYTFANKNIKYPEPENSKAPKHLVWNSDTGGYYNPGKFEWDESSKRYIEKNSVSLEEASSKAYMSENNTEIWVEKHKNSVNALEKALVEYYYKRMDIPLQAQSTFFAGEEEILKVLTDLGPAYLQDMKNMLQSNDIWTVQMMYSINHITNIKNGNMIYSTSPEVKVKWIQEYEKLIRNTPTIVGKYANQLKINSNDIEAKEEILNCGIFALPYIADEFKNGNFELAGLLAELVNQKESTHQDIDYWKNWINQHNDDIEIARNIVITEQKNYRSSNSLKE